MSTSSTANLPFTGISQYASNFQGILNKAVQVAQIPLTQLQTQDSNVLSQKTTLGSLNNTVGSLTSSLNALASLSQGLTATSSNNSAVTANNTGATAATTYTINSVTSVASAASERTSSSYSAATPVSTGTMTLVVNGTAQTIQLTSNNLNTLASQISGLGAGVTATVVSSGSGSALSITSGGGATSIQLYDGASATGTDLLSSTGSGTETSTATYADPAATQVSNGTMTLTLGSQSFTFGLTGNNLTSLENQINASGAGVTASILTTSGGNYLSLAANSTGVAPLALYDGASAIGTNLLTNTNPGTNASFELNGIPITQTSNTVNAVIPGVTLTIAGKSTAATTITVASDPTQLSSALQDFVTQYNAVQTAVQAQEGAAAGPLGGDTVVQQLQTMLNQIGSYTSSTGTVQSLSDLGVTFNDTTGQLTFNQSTFNGLSPTQVTDAFKFVGTATTGFGAFGNELNGFSDPITGLIQTEEAGLTRTDQDLQAHIATLNTQVSTMQAALTIQLETADAMQSRLQQQQSDLTASLQGLSLVLYGPSQQIA